MRLYDGYLFDLDGTIYLGEELIPGADLAVASLRQRGARVLFLSNKPIARRETYAEKLTRLGIPASADDVVNSPLASARYLSREHPGARVMVLGEAPLERELLEAGVELTERVEEAEIVLVSWDRQITYQQLDAAHQALLRGARFFATNPDVVCPLEGGRTVPDSGANIAYLQASTGRQLEVLIGKPSPIITEMAMAQIGLQARQCLMVGDRLDTDMAMGETAGLDTALVLTGVTSREDLERSEREPTYVLHSVAELAEAL
ncbi:MAG: HAD-IIA family hydrolase [Armatimonadota bacterium]